MGKRMPLTTKEKYIAKEIGALQKWQYGTVGNPKEAGWVPRPPSSVRAIFAYREQDKQLVKEFREYFERIQQGFDSYREFLKVANLVNELSKFQKYLVRDYVEACIKAESMTDEQMKRDMLLSEI